MGGTYLSAPYSSRNQFGAMLNGRGLLDTAVEVGSHRGDFAEVLLASWKGGRLLCVDPYLPDYDPVDPASGGDRLKDLAACQRRLDRFPGRGNLLLATSLAIAETLPDGSVDFVYLDACHQLEAVTADLAAWWPKVRPGGVLAGHDWLCPGEVRGGWGQYVQPAVAAFARREGLDVSLIVEEGGQPWSFYVERPL